MQWRRPVRQRWAARSLDHARLQLLELLLVVARPSPAAAPASRGPPPRRPWTARSRRGSAPSRPGRASSPSQASRLTLMLRRTPTTSTFAIWLTSSTISITCPGIARHMSSELLLSRPGPARTVDPGSPELGVPPAHGGRDHRRNSRDRKRHYQRRSVKHGVWPARTRGRATEKLVACTARGVCCSTRPGRQREIQRTAWRRGRGTRWVFRTPTRSSGLMSGGDRGRAGPDPAARARCATCSTSTPIWPKDSTVVFGSPPGRRPRRWCSTPTPATWSSRRRWRGPPMVPGCSCSTA